MSELWRILRYFVGFAIRSALCAVGRHDLPDTPRVLLVLTAAYYLGGVWYMGAWSTVLAIIPILARFLYGARWQLPVLAMTITISLTDRAFDLPDIVTNVWWASLLVMYFWARSADNLQRAKQGKRS